MPHFVRILVTAAGPKPYPVYAVLRDLLRAGGTVEVKRQLDAGPIEFRHLGTSQAESFSTDLRRLGAEFSTAPDVAPPRPKKKRTPPNPVAKLTAIGPYTLDSDSPDLWLATWDSPPGLESPLGHFGLEFRIELGDGQPLRPDAKMFKLWRKWKARHAEFAAKIQRAVEERMRPAGFTGPASEAIHSPQVSITRIDVDEYEASANVGLAFDAEHGLAYQMDEETGELEFWG